MPNDPSLPELDARLGIVEYAIQEIKQSTKEMAAAVTTIATVQVENKALAETVKSLAEDVRAVQNELAERRGVLKLLAWVGPIPLLMITVATLVAAGIYFFHW